MANISRREFISGSLAFLGGLATGYTLIPRIELSRSPRINYELYPWAEKRVINYLQSENPPDEFLEIFLWNNPDEDLERARELALKALKNKDAPYYLERVPELYKRGSNLGDIFFYVLKDLKQELSNKERTISFTVGDESEPHIFEGYGKDYLDSLRGIKDDISSIEIIYNPLLLYYLYESQSEGECVEMATFFSIPQRITIDPLKRGIGDRVPWIYIAAFYCGDHSFMFVDGNLNGRVDYVLKISPNKEEDQLRF